VNDAPMAGDLAAALESELRSLAAQAPREWRLRLLVAAHAAGLLVRDTASSAAEQPGDGSALVTAILAGDHDLTMPTLIAQLRTDVAARLAIAAPEYLRPDRRGSQQSD